MGAYAVSKTSWRYLAKVVGDVVSLARSVFFLPCSTYHREEDAVFIGLAVTKTASGRQHVSPFLSEKLGGRSHSDRTLFVSQILVVFKYWNFKYREVLLGQAISLPVSIEMVQA